MDRKKKTLRRLILLKLMVTVAVAACSMLFGEKEARASIGWLKDEMHFADTLKSQNKRAQFLKAIELAPSTFVYKKIVWKDKSTVTVQGMKFNESMQNTLKSEIVTNDPKLSKNLKKLAKLMKPLNATCDLTVSYHNVDVGIAVSYDIGNISFFSGK